MNWTGGTLQRHSKTGRRELLQRQRRHFSRVRQQLQNNTNSGIIPFRPSWLTPNQLTSFGVVTLRGPVVAQRHIGNSSPRQTTLEDFEATAPLARRLASMSKKSSRQHATTGTSATSTHSDKGGDFITRPHHAIDSRHDAGKGKKRGKPQSQSSSFFNSQKHQTSNLKPEDALELGRKRLLQQTDWVGLAASRPIHMKFLSHHDKSQIGKRRKVTKQNARNLGQSGQLVQYSTVPLIEHPFHEEEFFMRGALQPAPDRISVRIGNDALHSQMTDVALDDVDPLRTNSQCRQSADTMLFDEEQAEPVHHNLSTYAAVSIKSTTSSWKEEGRPGSLPTGSIDESLSSLGASPGKSTNGILKSPGEGHEEITYDVFRDDLAISIEVNELLEDLSGSPRSPHRNIVSYKEEAPFGGQTKYQKATADVTSCLVSEGPVPSPKSSQPEEERASSKVLNFVNKQPSNSEKQVNEDYKQQDAVEYEVSEFHWTKYMPPSKSSHIHNDTIRKKTHEYGGENSPQLRPPFEYNTARSKKTAEAISDPNELWRRFVFDDSSGSEDLAPGHTEHEATPQPDHAVDSSLFVWGTSSSSSQSRPVASSVALIHAGTERNLRPSQFRSNYHDIASVSNTPRACLDTSPASLDGPSPTDRVLNKAESKHTTVTIPSNIVASMTNNASVSAAFPPGVTERDYVRWSRLAEESSLAPTTKNVLLTTITTMKNTTSPKDGETPTARREDSRPVPVKFARPVRFDSSGGREPSRAATNASIVHAQAARRRPGPRRRGPAGSTGKGKTGPGAAVHSALPLSNGRSIFELPKSEEEDGIGGWS